MSKWMPMTWKKKDKVFVNKTSWDSQEGLVEYKYDLKHSKIYKGSRSKFSSPKTGKKSSKKSSKSTKKRKYSRSSKKYNNYSNTNNTNSSLSQPSISETQQKINDFLIIATGSNQQIAESLLRNSSWDVQIALEFYFKHQNHINSGIKQQRLQSQPIQHSHNQLPTKPISSTSYRNIDNQAISKNMNKKPRKSRKPSNTIKFGKAGTRTEHQKKLVKENYEELYKSFNDNEVICFTDGACRGNPGPSGSGCVVLYGKNTKTNFIQRSIALGRHTNNISELYAIGLALHIIQQHPSSKGWIKGLKHIEKNRKIIIRILSDSRYSIGVLSKHWKIKKNIELINWIKKDLDVIFQSNFLVFFHWVGGHSGIPYNEMADSLANKGVDGSIKNKSVDITKPPDLFNYNIRKPIILEIDDDDDDDEEEEEEEENDGLFVRELRINNDSNPLKRPNKKRKYKCLEIEDLKNDNKNKLEYNPLKRRKLNVMEESDDEIEIIDHGNNNNLNRKKEEEDSDKSEASQKSMNSTPPQSPHIE